MVVLEMTVKPVGDSISTFVSMKPVQFFFTRCRDIFKPLLCQPPPDISSHIDTIFM